MTAETVLDQWHGTFNGPLDVDKLSRAWRMSCERHSVLQASFHSSGLKEPVQVVHETIRIAVAHRELARFGQRGTNQALAANCWKGSEQEWRWIKRRCTESRWSRLASRRFKFLWTVPALLLDGWSWPLVFRDLSRVLPSLLAKGDPPALAAGAGPIAITYPGSAGSSENDTEQFWREKLEGHDATDALDAMSIGAPSSAKQTSQWPVELHVGRGDYVER